MWWSATSNLQADGRAGPCGRFLAAAAFCLMVVLGVVCAAQAADPGPLAAKLSNEAFALLNATTASGISPSDPLLGSVASFAGDAQTLNNALKGGDRQAASKALGSLEADESALQANLKGHAALVSGAQWEKMKRQLAALAAALPPGSAGTSSAAEHSEAPSGGAPAAAPVGGGPKVVIGSRAFSQGVLHLKGYMEGSDLQSAGIYEGRRRIENLKVAHVSGLQRVNFDLELGSAGPSTVIRVRDDSGRTAEAPALARVAMAPPGESGAGGSSSMPEVIRGDRMGGSGMSEVAPDSGAGNTAEIPSRGAPGARRGTHGGGSLVGVKITVSAVTMVSTMPRRYEVVGQIVGAGLTRAGIYVNGHEVKPIPLQDAAGYSSFDVTFETLGNAATIRAYGGANRFVESSVNLSAGGLSGYASSPPVGIYSYGGMATNPFAYGVTPYGYGAMPYSYPYSYGASPYGFGASPFGYGMGGYGMGGYGGYMGPGGGYGYGMARPYGYGSTAPMGPSMPNWWSH